MSAPSLDLMLNKLKRYPLAPRTILAFDPGETTGWARVCWDQPFDPQFAICDQVETSSVAQATDAYDSLLYRFLPDIVLIEEYRVYSWKSDQHKWSDVITLRLIGCLETLCHQRELKWHKQMAVQAKEFCTDDKLSSWDLYEKGKKHGRDAMRHACQFMLFNKEYTDLKG